MMSSRSGSRARFPLPMSISSGLWIRGHRGRAAGYRHLDANNERPRYRPNRQVLNEAGVETAWNAASFSVGVLSSEVKGRARLIPRSPGAPFVLENI